MSLDLEDLLSHAHRAKDMLTGVVAILTTPSPMVPTACNVILEARAQLGSIVDALESLAMRRAEDDRALQLHKQAQAKLTAGVVVVGAAK